MQISKIKILNSLLILIPLAFLVTTCGDQVLNPNDIARILVENDEGMLNHRIQYFDDKEVPIEPAASLNKEGDFLTKNVQLRLLAEVEPPTLNGRKLHASHVTLQEGYAYVSYSTVNADFGGGVEIFDTHIGDRPIIRSMALFNDTDVSIAMEMDGKLYLGEATDSDHNSDFKSPAVLEVITLENHRLTNHSQRIDLPSFNANDVAVFDNAIFVTSGTTNGALSVFEQNSLSLLDQIPIHGAKAVAQHTDFVVVMEGTGTNLHLYERSSRKFLTTINLGCPNFFTAKAEIDVVRDKVYLSAWDCGMMVVDLEEKVVTSGIPAPNGSFCNAVSVDGDLLLMANGSAGLLIARITETGFEEIGSAKFEGSTNFVAAKDDLVFVANGTGGLKILRMVRERVLLP